MKSRYFIIFFIFSLLSSLSSARPQEPYSPFLAQTYANQWVDNTVELRNPVYLYYPSDCANFVSQTLRAGGWRNTAIGPAASDLYWYYASASQVSDTWKVANALHRRFAFNYESWYGGLVINPSTLRARVGDVIFADWTGDSIIDHAMIVTGTGASGEPLVSYHTTDRENYPWSALLARFPPPSYTPKFYKYSPVPF